MATTHSPPTLVEEGVTPQSTATVHSPQYDEKKGLSAEISPSVTGEPTLEGWRSRLKARFRVGASQPPYAVYPPRPLPPPTGSIGTKIWNFFKFLGPGAIISVAYVDPDNYQTAIASGAEFQYKLLFMVLVSNLIAIYIQVIFDVQH